LAKPKKQSTARLSFQRRLRTCSSAIRYDRVPYMVGLRADRL